MARFYCDDGGDIPCMDEIEVVLIEDDEDAAQCMLKFLKTAFDVNVRYIQDGQRAAEYLLFNYDKGPKLILLNLLLPHIDGAELYEIIKREPESKKFFVVFLVNDESEIRYIESRGMKPDGYWKKAKPGSPPVRLKSSQIPIPATQEQTHDKLTCKVHS